MDVLEFESPFPSCRSRPSGAIDIELTVSLVSFSDREITIAVVTTAMVRTRIITRTSTYFRRFPRSLALTECWLRDGSYYYSNPNGSKYYNDGQGGATYTPPSDSGKK